MAKSKKQPTGEPHWAVLVELYFEFCKKKFGTPPSFDGAQGMAMRHLIRELKKRSETSGFEWTCECATQTFNTFLEVAITEPWIAKNFMLPILNAKKDSIFFKIASNGKYIQQKQSTGGAINTASAFSKIDQLFGSSSER